MNGLFKKKPGILSSRMVVRPHIAWPTRLLIIALVCLLTLLLAWGMYEIGRQTAGVSGSFSSPNLDESIDTVACLQKDRRSLCVQLAEVTRQLQIVQTTNNDLAEQTRLLSKENNRLKEELDFFEHVIAGNTKIKSGVSIHHFSLKQEASPGLYRYTLSLVQGGQRPKDFNGSLKFLVNLRQNNQRKTVLLSNKATQQNFSINFKFYHRIEENFKVPPETVVESMEVQVFEQGDTQVKLTQKIDPVF